MGFAGMNDAKSIGDVLNGEEAFKKFREKVFGYKVVDEFYEIFPEWKKIVKPRKVEFGTLVLRVEDAVWRSELNLNKEKIISKINDYFQKEVVKRIRFL